MKIIILIALQKKDEFESQINFLRKYGNIIDTNEKRKLIIF